MIPDTPPRQVERLAALRRYDILDTPEEDAYNHIAKLAALICQTPIAVVNFIDEKRQWFKSEIGLGVRETPLAPSICAHAILQEEMFVIPDTLLDPRFIDNPLCASDPHLRFYAGALLATADKLPLGTLCVLDYVPRTLSLDQREALRMLSLQVMHLLELRRNLRSLRESEVFAQSAIESSPDCTTVLDLAGRLLTMNAAGRRLMQIDDFAPHVLTSWLEMWRDPHRDGAQAALDLARSGNTGQFQGYCPTLKGAPKWWDVLVTPIRDGDGGIAKFLSTARDVTLQRRVEEKLRDSAKLESLGVMAGGIAHDFNNLLTGIMGNASLLVDYVASTERPFAEEIVKASERAAHLTRQMLAYSGKGRFELTRVNLSKQVREILPLIQSSIGTIAVTLNLEDDLPDIKADHGQIQQLVMNLIINAAEAMVEASGCVVITTGAADIDQAYIEQAFASEPLRPGWHVWLEVHDTGVGMGEDTLAKIFDPFFTTKFTGRGLGLAAVSGIVRGHNGALRVNSALGRGTTFKVLFPVHVFDQIKAVPEPQREPAKHRGTILFVDDEEVVRRVGKSALERGGFTVRLASNGQEAIDLFRTMSSSTSLVVLDMTMPVMSGQEVFGRLREVRADVPIVVSSGYNEVEVIRRFTAGNIAGFIQKPYTLTQLVNKVQAILALHSEAAI
jgi:PAS domain S-box-containing protein